MTGQNDIYIPEKRFIIDLMQIQLRITRFDSYALFEKKKGL